MELPGYLNRFDFDGGSTGRNGGKSNWSGSDGEFQFKIMVFLIRGFLNSKTSFSDISAWFEMTDIINMNIKLDILKNYFFEFS